MCNPSFKNVFKIDPFGLAFIAYLTVNPYAFGNAFALSAWFFSVCKSYTYTGVPNSSLTCFTSWGDKNRSFSTDEDDDAFTFNVLLDFRANFCDVNEDVKPRRRVTMDEDFPLLKVFLF
jgi:hypothetical protein